MAENSAQRSSLKNFLASLATIKGDLSNITAPPFVLADKSTTEFPRYWIEQPQLFYAPAKEQDSARRILAVLKWFLSSLKAQQYAGRKPTDGTKKPLNAFLGEIFTGSCGAEGEETRLVAEQVSHHPPVTACYLWNDKHGVRAEGYTRQEITFSGSVNIQQIGYAVLHVDAYDEDYLIPLPNVKVKGILTGSPYPELQGSYSIVSTAGYIAVIDFSGKNFLGIGGAKNHVDAAIYRADDKKHEHALFRASGSWSEHFEIKDDKGEVIDSYDVAAAQPTDFHTLPLEEQDPWESRNAWKGVIDAIHADDMQGVADHKSALENAQRALRKQPETDEKSWRSLFFRHGDNPIAERLLGEVGLDIQAEKTCGIWRFDNETFANAKRPWRGDLTPHGKMPPRSQVEACQDQEHGS